MDVRVHADSCRNLFDGLPNDPAVALAERVYDAAKTVAMSDLPQRPGRGRFTSASKRQNASAWGRRQLAEFTRGYLALGRSRLRMALAKRPSSGRELNSPITRRSTTSSERQTPSRRSKPHAPTSRSGKRRCSLRRWRSTNKASPTGRRASRMRRYFERLSSTSERGFRS